LEIKNIQDKIKTYSSQTESRYLSLADKFSALLNVQGRTSLEELQEMFVEINKKNASSVVQEKSVVDSFTTKYAALFDELNTKIKELDALNVEVGTIKDDSEEMELITLNSMVVSIKSGDKGRAFSCIADNLKRLSNQMYLFSDSLYSEEQKLLNNITSLKQIFTGIVASQNMIASMENSSTVQIRDFLQNASLPLDGMAELTKAVYVPIQKTMEGLQSQDIIRQALDHVLICLDECNVSALSDDDTSKEALDTVCYNIELLKISKKVLDDVIQTLTESVAQYDKNWDELSSTLSTLEVRRKEYIDKNLNAEHTSDTMLAGISSIMQSFSLQMNEFNNYYLSQKDLESTCSDITGSVRIMMNTFENLTPIVSSLHHIRILQQIEVAKNEAIASVRDSVADMDKYIESAKKSLDTMQDMLQNFTNQLGQQLQKFQDEVSKDNAKMMQGKKLKNVFFGDLKTAHGRISDILHNFTVLPPQFEKQCDAVKGELNDLTGIKNSFAQILMELADEESVLERRRQHILEVNQLTDWSIQNDKFKEVIQHFTITAHKKAAGEIGGFAVEKGSAAGEITFF
jgi:hypothetical protein